MDALSNIDSSSRRGGLSKRIVCGIGGAVGAAAMVYLVISAPHVKAPDDHVATQVISTRMGEHRCEKLPDGSSACLNTNTTLRYTFTAHARNIELVSGEAYFEVQSKDARPFDVISGDLLVHDVSTSFDVYKKVATTLVTVINGRVKIVAPVDSAFQHDFKLGVAESLWRAAPEFHQLQQVEFDEATRMLHARHSLNEDEVVQLLAWKRGRIDLNGRTLRDALTEFSRYLPIDRFIIPERSLRDFQVGGELDALNLKDFLDTLEVVHHIHHTITTAADGKMTVTLFHKQNAQTHSTHK